MIKMVQRGCGFPIAGGVYLKTDLSVYGTPWQYFLLDPTIPIYNPEEMGISAQGISFTEEDDHFNLVDWVGASHYEFVPCFIEEGIRLGFSRRIPKTADFRRITQKSRHILLHTKAAIGNPDPYYANRIQKKCHTNKPDHVEPNPWGCISLLWEAMDHGKQSTDRSIEYKMPSFSFNGWQSPEGTKPEFQLAAFMWLPISRIEVVADNQDGTHQKALEILEKSRTEIPYELADYGDEVIYDSATVTPAH